MPKTPPASPRTSPFDLKSEDGYFWLKGNLHSHTTNSDGRCSPQERVDDYAGRGYGFLCLSDHYRITRVDSVRAPKGLTLIQGAELHPENPFGGQTHHFLALDIHEDMDSQKMPPQHVIDAVRKQGGSIWLAHPHWSSVNVLRDAMPLRGLAGLEVFNTTCRCHARGESSVHWDDWMALADWLCPALATDDCHAQASQQHDTFQGWTMVRVGERTPGAIVEALERGAAYSSTGPEIRDIRLTRSPEDRPDRRVVQATVSCSEARRIYAVCDAWGVEFHRQGLTFDSATFDLLPGAKYVRFEVVGPDGSKAWSNPFDLAPILAA